MVAFVVSVERITVTVDTTSGATSFDGSLSKGQDETKCVPFHTNRATSSGDDFRPNDWVALEMVDVTGTPTVRVHRFASNTIQALSVEIFVVEFGSNVTVKQGGPTALTGTTASATLSPAIVLNNSFAVFSQVPPDANGSDDWNDTLIQCRFGSTASINFDRRAAGNPDWDIYWYVVESDGTDFLTEYVTADWTNAQTGPTGHTLTTDVSDVANAFIVSTFETTENADDLKDASCNFALTATDTLTWYRNNNATTSASGTFGVWVVRSSNVTVQRFALDLAASTTNDQTITSVDQTTAIVLSSGHTAGGAWGTDGSSDGGDIEDRRNTLTFTADSNVRAQQLEAEAATGADSRLRFEVIEFDLETAGPTETTLAATATGSGTIAFTRSLSNITNSATDTGAATILQQSFFSRVVSAVSTGVATLFRRATYSRALSATATGVATLIEQLVAELTEITLAATATVAATLRYSWPGAIARLGEPAGRVFFNTMDYTVPDGSNRMLVACFMDEDNANTANLDSVDYGGQAMVEAVQTRTVTAGISAGVSIWYLLEAGITAATDNTITATYNEAINEQQIQAMAFENVNQVGGTTTNPATASALAESSTPNPIVIDITETNNGAVIGAAVTGAAQTVSWQADMTVVLTQPGSTSAGTSSDRLSTTDSTVNVRPTWTVQNRSAGVSATFAPLGALAAALTLAATVTGVAFLLRQTSFARLVSAVSTGVATLLRRWLTSRTLSATATASTALLRRLRAFRNFVASAVGTATMVVEELGVTLTELTLAAVSTAVATIERQWLALRTLPATATGSATLLRRWLTFRALSATATGAAVLAFTQPFTQIVLSATATGVAILRKRIDILLSATATGTATLIALLVELVEITLAATVTATATLTFRRSLSFKTIFAQARHTSTLELPNQVTIATAVASGIATLSHVTPFYARVFHALVTGQATEKNSPHAIVFEAESGPGQYQLSDTTKAGNYELITGGDYDQIGDPNATLLVVTIFNRIIAATVTGIATLIQSIPIFLRTLTATATGSATLAFNRALSNITLAASAVGSAVLVRLALFRRILAATATGIATLIELLIEALTQITLAATATGVATLNRLVTSVRVLTATVTGVATLAFNRAFTNLTLAATATATATLSRLALYFRTFAAAVTGVATLISGAVIPLTEIVLAATVSAVATIQSLYIQFVKPFTGHGGMGFGDKQGRWRRRVSQWKRRK